MEDFNFLLQKYQFIKYELEMKISEALKIYEVNKKGEETIKELTTQLIEEENKYNVFINMDDSEFVKRIFPNIIPTEKEVEEKRFKEMSSLLEDLLNLRARIVGALANSPFYQLEFGIFNAIGRSFGYLDEMTVLFDEMEKNFSAVIEYVEKNKIKLLSINDTVEEYKEKILFSAGLVNNINGITASYFFEENEININKLNYYNDLILTKNYEFMLEYKKNTYEKLRKEIYPQRNDISSKNKVSDKVKINKLNVVLTTVIFSIILYALSFFMGSLHGGLVISVAWGTAYFVEYSIQRGEPKNSHILILGIFYLIVFGPVLLNNFE